MAETTKERDEARVKAMAKYFGALVPSSPDKIRAQAHWLKGFDSGYTAALAEQALRIEELEKALKLVRDCGHNLDCIFCGFKDKVVLEAFAGKEKKDDDR